MATSHPIRLSLIGPLRAGSEVEARLLIGHPMDSGYRTDDSGQPIARNIIESVRVQLDGQLLLDAEVSIGISANPYFSFPVPVPARGGTLLVEWRDDRGERGQFQRLLLPE